MEDTDKWEKTGIVSQYNWMTMLAQWERNQGPEGTTYCQTELVYFEEVLTYSLGIVHAGRIIKPRMGQWEQTAPIYGVSWRTPPTRCT